MLIALPILSFMLTVIIGFAEVVIGGRVLLKFLGANPTSEFVAWVYAVSRTFLIPFENIFPTINFTGGFVIELSSLFAMLVYSFAGYLVRQLYIFFGTQKEEKNKGK